MMWRGCRRETFSSREIIVRRLNCDSSVRSGCDRDYDAKASFLVCCRTFLRRMVLVMSICDAIHCSSWSVEET